MKPAAKLSLGNQAFPSTAWERGLAQSGKFSGYVPVVLLEVIQYLQIVLGLAGSFSG
jgi:hypothetical protein